MGNDAENAAAWQAGINSVNNSVGVIATSSTNKKTRQWNEKIMGQQREWALADWQRQVDYNAPNAQMERLKAAGLNPNLVYGNGAAQQSSPTVKSSDAPSWNPQPPQMPHDRGLSDYFTVQAQGLQLDNLRAQNTVLMNDAALKDAQRIATLRNADNSGFDLSFKAENRNLDIEQKRMNLSNSDLQMQGQDLRNQWYARTQDMNLQQTVQQILQSQQQTEESKQRVQNMIKSGKLLDYENKLHDLGVQKNDPIYWRVIAEIFKTMGFGN